MTDGGLRAELCIELGYIGYAGLGTFFAEPMSSHTEFERRSRLAWQRNARSGMPLRTNNHAPQRRRDGKGADGAGRVTA